MKDRYVLKIVVGGDGGVGKTSMLRRFVDGMFDSNTTMTVGVDFYIKELIVDGMQYSLQIWDLGGQERFRFMLENYIKGARGALMLFDLSNFTSFMNVSKWIYIIRTWDDTLPVLLVGTKMDLVDLIAVGDEDMKRMVRACKMIGSVKTSARSCINIDGTFEILMRHVARRLGIANHPPRIGVPI